MKKLISSVLVMAMLAISVMPAFAVNYGEEYQNQPQKTYSQKFSDVPKTYWAFSYIGEMNERGVISGYPNGKYYPDNNVTRAEFAKIMAVAGGLSANDYSLSFSDVSENDWFCPYVNAAKYYLSGYNYDGNYYYRPDTNALREDIAVALVKLKGYDTSGYDLSILKTMFTDYTSISDSAKKYVATAVEKGLISGYEDDTFRGQDSITRAEAATLLWRAYQYGNGNKDFDMNQSTATPVPTSTPFETPTPEIVATPTPTPEPTATPTPTPTPTPAGWTVKDLRTIEYDDSDYREFSITAYKDDTYLICFGDKVTQVTASGEKSDFITVDDMPYVKLNKLDSQRRFIYGVKYDKSHDKVYLGLYARRMANQDIMYPDYEAADEDGIYDITDPKNPVKVSDDLYYRITDSGKLVAFEPYNDLKQPSVHGPNHVYGVSHDIVYMLQDNCKQMNLLKYNYAVQDWEPIDCDTEYNVNVHTFLGFFNDKFYAYNKIEKSIIATDLNGDTETIVTASDISALNTRNLELDRIVLIDGNNTMIIKYYGSFDILQKN